MKTNTERAESRWMRLTGVVAFVGILGLAATGCGDEQAQDHNTALAKSPTVSISANPMVVPAQGSSTLTWSSMYATSCTASRAWSGTQAIAGTASTGALSQDSTFTLTCTGAGGSTSASVTVTIDPCNGCWDYPSPPVVTLTASPMSVAYGASSTLTWSSTDATSCTASGAWSGAQDTAGSISTGALTAYSTYTITCSGAGGTATKSVTVLVGSPPAPIVAISANPTVVDAGASSTLTWSSTDATSCTASGAWSGAQDTAGSISTGALTANSTYTITCSGAGGTATESATVLVVGSLPAPIVAISANPAVVDAWASSTLTWSSTDATSCTASGAWSGTQATAGTASTGALNDNSTFTLTCTGPGGSTSASATVTIANGCAGCWDY